MIQGGAWDGAEGVGMEEEEKKLKEQEAMEQMTNEAVSFAENMLGLFSVDDCPEDKVKAWAKLLDECAHCLVQLSELSELSIAQAIAASDACNEIVEIMSELHAKRRIPELTFVLTKDATKEEVQAELERLKMEFEELKKAEEEKKNSLGGLPEAEIKTVLDKAGREEKVRAVVKEYVEAQKDDAWKEHEITDDEIDRLLKQGGADWEIVPEDCVVFRERVEELKGEDDHADTEEHTKKSIMTTESTKPITMSPLRPRVIRT
jgi:arsenate reductase-like glutaredoxin family protein